VRAWSQFDWPAPVPSPVLPCGRMLRLRAASARYLGLVAASRRILQLVKRTEA